MKQTWSHESYAHKYYEKYYSVWGYDPPNRVDQINQSYSNDLNVSGNHLVSMLGKTGEDIGGDFNVVKRSYSEESSLGPGDHVFSHPWGRWEGLRVTPQFAKFANFGNEHFPQVDPTNIVELAALGRQAISMCAPTKSSFDGAEFIGELREGLPSIVPFAANMKSRTARARNAGDEYLNVEFGWKPLIRDYQSFQHTIENSEAILDEYERKSGTLLRRRYNFPVQWNQEIREDAAIGAVPLIDQTNLYTPGGYFGTLRTTTTSETRRWFSGAFKYYFPKRGDSLRKTAELQKLYGLKVSPDVLWNLAPWSWAADWIGDAGVLAKNLTLFSNDNLVMPYAYLMETKSVRVEYQLSGISYASIGSETDPTYDKSGEQWFRQTFETVCKTRLKASPYGFDIDWPDFSGRQIAILAALGKSRA